MNRKLRIIRPRHRPFNARPHVFASSSSAVLRQRTVHYWAWTYGTGVPAYSPDYDCECRVGPCAPAYEIVGEKTFYCDGTTTQWGYVGHACADITLTLGPLCYQPTPDA